MTIATSKNLTIVGIATILTALGALGVAVFDGDPLTVPNFGATIGLVMAGVGMILGKGAQSTGGTVNGAGAPVTDPSPPVPTPAP